MTETITKIDTERLSKEIEYIPVPTLITSLDGRCLAANSLAISIVGYTSREEFMNIPIIEHYANPEDRERLLAEFKKAGKVKNFELEVKMRGEGTTWVNASTNSAVDLEGNTILINTYEEISEKRAAVDAFKESDARYRMIHSMSFDGIIIADREGIIEECNESANRIFGYDEGELIGEPITVLMPEEYREAHGKGLDGLSEGGDSEIQGHILELKGQRKNGEVFPCELTVNSYTVNDKMFLSGTIRDISGRKKGEEDLELSRESLNEAQRIAHIGNWEWDIQENTSHFSDEVCRIFGIPKGAPPMNYEEFIGHVHPDDRMDMESAIEKSLSSDTPYSVEHRLIRNDGTRRLVRDSGKVYRDSTGAPVRMVGTVQDITERKERDDERIRSQKLDSLGVLAGGIAHDFNNILTGILSNLYLVRKDITKGTETYRRVSNTEDAAYRAKDLTQQLLVFSKGGTPILESMSIKGLIEESVNFLLSGSNVAPHVRIDEDVKDVYIDKGQIEQVFGNIIINAKQAMPEGGTLSVRASNRLVTSGGHLPLPHGEYVRISIKDKGVGMGKDLLSKIFDPYFTTKENGTGLGLAVTYSIIKNHEGLITVDSILGEGTTFNIHLPVSESVVDMIDRGAAGGPVDEAGAEFKNVRILVMDDDEVVRNAATDLLKDMGYTVDMVSSGEEAVEAYRNAMEKGSPYTLLLFDLTIPGGMGGEVAFKEILKIDREAKC